MYEQVPEWPIWYQRAKYEGKEYPCPICEATGLRPSVVDMVYENNLKPHTKCYHCQGSGDESTAIRRNRQGGRPVA